MDASTNYLSQSEMSAHFGLGSADEVARLRVRWTDGTETTLVGVSADRTITVSYGTTDLNADGETGVSDYAAYLELLFSGDAGADRDGDGVVDARDYFAYLVDFFAAGGP